MILDGGDLAQRNPVLFGGGGGSACNLSGGLLVDLEGKVDFSELFLAEVGEGGDSEGTGGVVLDLFEVLGEDFHSVDFLVGVRELLVVGELESLPLFNH